MIVAVPKLQNVQPTWQHVERTMLCKDGLLYLFICTGAKGQDGIESKFCPTLNVDINTMSNHSYPNWFCSITTSFLKTSTGHVK